MFTDAEKTANNNIHAAIIMDGNGRWADTRGQPRVFGHLEGAERVKEIITQAADIGLGTLTIWGYSTANGKRPKNEVNALMGIFKRFIVRETDELAKKNVFVTFIGDRTPLPLQLQRVMELLEVRTKDNDGLHLQIALNYDGQDEIVRAVNKALSAGEMQMSAETIAKYLDTTGVSDPDVIIRTSGEMRLSGFMPWQSKHSELVFVAKHWPDFTPEDLDAALVEFRKRNRRFGGLSVAV